MMKKIITKGGSSILWPPVMWQSTRSKSFFFASFWLSLGLLNTACMSRIVDEQEALMANEQQEALMANEQQEALIGDVSVIPAIEDSSVITEHRQPPRRLLLTFLGFHGHTSCFGDVHEEMVKEDIECIEVSPQTLDYDYSNICQKLDACYMSITGVHLGLGSIKSQARAVSSLLEDRGITDTDEIILLGHSQGGLTGVEFWRRFRRNYNIKGIVTMSAPLQGICLIDSLGDVDKVRRSHQFKRTESRCSQCIQTFCFPYCIVPFFRKICCCCCPGLTDLAPNSTLLREHKEEVYQEMRSSNFPFLAIQAEQFSAVSAPPSSYRKKVAFLCSGSDTLPNDGLIATHCQIPPGDRWDQLDTITLQANHGMEIVEDHPRIFIHTGAINKLREFCKAIWKDD